MGLLARQSSRLRLPVTNFGRRLLVAVAERCRRVAQGIRFRCRVKVHKPPSEAWNSTTNSITTSLAKRCISPIPWLCGCELSMTGRWKKQTRIRSKNQVRCGHVAALKKEAAAFSRRYRKQTSSRCNAQAGASPSPAFPPSVASLVPQVFSTSIHHSLLSPRKQALVPVA